eukprot:10331-Heterococcus_DN1.PRE.2
MGLVHTTVFHFGFMLKLALRVSASNPAFILLSLAAFAQEAVGLRYGAVVTTRALVAGDSVALSA